MISVNIDDLSTSVNDGKKKSKYFHRKLSADIKKMIKDKKPLWEIEDQVIKRGRGYLSSRYKRARRDWEMGYNDGKPARWKPKAVQFPKLSRGYAERIGEKIKTVCEHYDKLPHLFMNQKLDQKWMMGEEEYSLFESPVELKKEYQRFKRRAMDKTLKTYMPEVHDMFTTITRVGRAWVARTVIILKPKSKKEASRKGFYQKMMGKLLALWNGSGNFLSNTRGGGLVKKFYERIEPLLTANWDDDDITLTQMILMINGIHHWYHGDEVSKLLREEHEPKICPACRVVGTHTEMEWIKSDGVWCCPNCGYEEDPMAWEKQFDKVETYTTSGPDTNPFFDNKDLKYFTLDVMLKMIEQGQAVRKKVWTKNEVEKLNIPELPKFNLDGLGAVA